MLISALVTDQVLRQVEESLALSLRLHRGQRFVIRERLLLPQVTAIDFAVLVSLVNFCDGALYLLGSLRATLGVAFIRHSQWHHACVGARVDQAELPGGIQRPRLRSGGDNFG